ncbi:unnamed protein product [Rotaria sp. Silwood2]|nr:unnamed protein product [Rotaria sp. Silwood2]CAF4432847.1 unnamed protein product [Rotaria sp. Silwood2]
MSNTSTILEPAKPPIVPPKPHTNISNNTHAPIPIPPPLPPPRNASLENQNPFSNIPPPLPPPLPIFSSEQMTNKPSTPSPKFQHNGFLQEILDYNKSKLKSEAERSTTLKTSSTNKSNGEVQRTLEANILEMIAQRRPGIMGRDNDNDDENDLNEDEWDE